MEITSGLVKELREKTGLGMMDCKKALVENNGDIEKSIDFLRKKGALKAESKSDRATSEGAIGSYIHMGGKVGVLLEVNCETDFVAKSDDFTDLVKDVAMHITAAKPLYVKREDVPAELIEKENSLERQDYATYLNNIGLLYIKLEKYEVAENYLFKALEIHEKISGQFSSNGYLMVCSNLGALYEKLDRCKDAESYYLISINNSQNKNSANFKDRFLNLSTVLLIYY